LNNRITLFYRYTGKCSGFYYTKSYTMPATRNDAEIELHRKVITEMYLKGNGHSVIASVLGIHRHTVAADLRELAKIWHQESIDTINEQKAIEMEKLYTIEKECWKAFEASKTKQIAVRGKEGVSIETIENEGNPAFLKMAMDCIDARCKIMGIYGAQDPKVIIQNAVVVVPQNGRDSPLQYDDAEILEVIKNSEQ
jgi:hypothetical protein